MIEGVDYSDDRPDLAALYATGRRFAVRYVGPGRESKQLTKAEAAHLASHGFDIACVAEGSAGGLLNGFATGRDWATQAIADARACGMPAHRPIYFAVDVDIDATKWPRVADGLRGAGSVVGRDNVGVYGEYDVIGWAFRDGVACYGWQTYAWSHGRIQPFTHAHQYRNGVEMAGATVDLDRAFTADFGQWRPGQVYGKAPLAPALGSRLLRKFTPMMSGFDVAYVQRHIGPYRCGRSDGLFGANTDAGVRWYQSTHGLRVDGIVGPQTWGAILGHPTALGLEAINDSLRNADVESESVSADTGTDQGVAN